jgi:hypothetical protein
VHNISEEQFHLPISINTLTKAFECPRIRVTSALESDLEPPGNRGKHPAFDHDRELQILDWIQENAEHSMTFTKTKITDYCTRQFQVTITRG